MSEITLVLKTFKLSRIGNVQMNAVIQVKSNMTAIINAVTKITLKRNGIMKKIHLRAEDIKEKRVA